MPLRKPKFEKFSMTGVVLCIFKRNDVRSYEKIQGNNCSNYGCFRSGDMFVKRIRRDDDYFLLYKRYMEHS